jgi:hypothetical protein
MPWGRFLKRNSGKNMGRLNGLMAQEVLYRLETRIKNRT